MKTHAQLSERDWRSPEHPEILLEDLKVPVPGDDGAHALHPYVCRRGGVGYFKRPLLTPQLTTALAVIPGGILTLLCLLVYLWLLSICVYLSGFFCLPLYFQIDAFLFFIPAPTQMSDSLIIFLHWFAITKTSLIYICSNMLRAPAP